MSVLTLVYWEGETVINCIMFTSTCTKCCHMCKTSGHVGPYHSWDTHPSFCFIGGRKCLVPVLGLGEAVWDGTRVTTIAMTWDYPNQIYVMFFYLKKSLAGFMSFIYFFLLYYQL